MVYVIWEPICTMAGAPDLFTESVGAAAGPERELR